MARAKTGKRRGPPTWARGSQLIFLRSRMSTWADCKATQRGKFYSDVTWLYLSKYGWDNEDNEDVDLDDSDMAAVREELRNSGTLEEQQQNQATFKGLRRVSHFKFSLSAYLTKCCGLSVFLLGIATTPTKL